MGRLLLGWFGCRVRHATRTPFLCVVFVSIATSAAARGPQSPANFAADVQGSLVTLTWSPPFGQTPDAYVLEGGVSPGDVMGSIPLAGGATWVTLAGPPGAFYLRLHAVASGVRGPPSNEIRVFVNVPPPPDAPTNVLGMALGSEVILTWTNPAGPFDSIRLDVTGAVSASLPIEASGALRVAGVPNGTYTLTLRATNATGVSGPSAAVTLTLPGSQVKVVRAPAQAASAPRLPVRLERMAGARLAQLRQRERLDAAVAGATSEFNGVLKLKDWVATQFPHGNPSPYPPWDAMTILDWIRAGITGGFCGQYAQVLLQSLAALGIPARYVELGHVDNPYAHYVVEAWSNEFGKWVVLDADFNLHFELNGVPQSALEVHDLTVTGLATQLSVVRGSVLEGHPSPASWPLGTAELYYYVRYHLNANQLGAPAEDPFDRYGDMVEWYDPRVVPWESSASVAPFPKERLTRHRTSDRSLVDAGLNQVWPSPRPVGPGEIVLDLKHNVVDFRRFESRVIDRAGTSGPWLPNVTGAVRWVVSPSDHVIEVRGVNVHGLPGPVSAVGVVPP